MIAITLSNSVSAFRSGGSPATLTITFGDGIVDDGVLYLTINGVQYSITLGLSGTRDVGIWFMDLSGSEVYGAEQIAIFFQDYIEATFAASLNVLRNVNIVTLTTKATSGASLSATCSLPIFPNAPL